MNDGLFLALGKETSDANPALALGYPNPDHHPARTARSVGTSSIQETIMGFGRGALLWLLGIPLPIILLLALFWR